MCITILVKDIWSVIIQYLDFRDLQALAQTNKHLRGVCADVMTPGVLEFGVSNINYLIPQGHDVYEYLSINYLVNKYRMGHIDHINFMIRNNYISDHLNKIIAYRGLHCIKQIVTHENFNIKIYHEQLKIIVPELYRDCLNSRVHEPAFYYFDPWNYIIISLNIHINNPKIVKILKNLTKEHLFLIDIEFIKQIRNFSKKELEVLDSLK